MKKFFVTLAVLMATFLPVISLNSAPVSAVSGVKNRCEYFLGLTSWDCGVTISNENNLKTGIWRIVINVVTDITVIAAYLIIGYVIYGGYLYIFSGGEPGKVATGKKALYQAFMGLAIIMSANIIMNSIRIALIGDTALGDCVTDKCIDPGTMVTNTIQWVVGIAGVIAAIFVVYGGIMYVTSSGDVGKLQSAKRMIIYSLIGLAIVAIAELVTSFVSKTIQDANKVSIINETTITKEVYENKIN